MSAAQASLQRALYRRLADDAGLTALIGADGVHDRLLDRTPMPYVLITEIESRNASTATEDGEEHLVTLEVRSALPGNREAQAIAARIRTLLYDAALTLDGGFSLVHLQHGTTRVTRERNGGGHVATVTLRAVTE